MSRAHNLTSIPQSKTFPAFGEIVDALRPYLDAARNGTTAGLRASFEDSARIFGWIDGQLLCLDPDAFVGWVAQNGGSPDIRRRIVSLDISGPAAAVRIEFENWLGFRFTDFFVLNQSRGVWRITSKVYDAHGRTMGPGGAGPVPGEPDGFGETAAIARLIGDYVEGARTGDRAKLRGNWFDHARIIGQLDGAQANRDPDAFAARVADAGGAPNVQALIVSIARSGAAASARIELNDWNGIRYTDFLTLLKGPEGWLISGKVFDAHGRR